MKMLITGGRGMLGRTLARHLQAEHQVLSVDRNNCNITNRFAIDLACRNFQPDVVLHCAAMTDVDGAESDPDAAFNVNELGTANVAAACSEFDARLIAFSTDYVFDGLLERPYHEGDAPNPQTVYGKSKLAGELAIRRLCPNHLILRTAWLYGEGGPSFLHTMLRLGSQPGPPIKVVNDQVGNPTSADAVARRVLDLLDSPVVGTWHLTSEGEATWYEFARAISREVPFARAVVPCTTADYPRPAPRPANSRLRKMQLERHSMQPMESWDAGLRAFLGRTAARRAA
jgi:dTDP-4-dehydrorhamnose reductase